MPFDLALSGDQEAIAELFGAFFTKESPPSVVREAEPLGFDRGLWESLRGLEAPGMGVPAEAGGGGASLSELVVACEAFGRSVAPVPLVEHLVAARAHPVVPVVSGEQVATFAVRPARQGAWRLAPAGAVADVVVGLDGDELVAVTSPAPMAAPQNHGSSPIADRSTTAGERTVVGDRATFERALDEWRTLTAAALVGISAQALDIALEYVKERHQFGRPIGAYQALQHGLADFPAYIDGGRLLTHKAAWALDRGERGDLDYGRNEVSDGHALSLMAFAFAADGAAVTTDRSLHYHGGYGFSQEYDIQLYFRRARGWANVLGDPARERLALADVLWPVEA